MTYCEFCNALPSDSDNPNKAYHDREYGFPVFDDNALFERLILEINQAGLNWTLILRKRQAFRMAYADFAIEKVAAFDEADVMRLLADRAIVRHRLKIQAAVFNARRILRLQNDYGSLKNWLDAHHPREKAAWVNLFKSHFQFVGGEIVGEFLMSLGYLAGAHQADCPIGERIKRGLGVI